MFPLKRKTIKIPSSVSLPPDLYLKVQDVAARSGVLRCHVIEECVVRSIDELPTLEMIGGKRNRAFVAPNTGHFLEWTSCE